MADDTSTPTPSGAAPTGLRTRLRFKAGSKLVLGPGRAHLLDLIDRTGSISAAAREMGMSYRRAWTLVDDTNRCFRAPLVESVTGGQRGGGARLTGTGRQVLDAYHRIAARTEAAIAEDKALLETLLDTDLPDAKRDPGTPS